MKYILDTCTISELIRPRPDKGVIDFIDNEDEDDLFLSVLTLGELQKGVAKVEPGERRTRLQSWLDRDLVVRFGARLLPVDAVVASTWGTLQGEAEGRGEPLPIMDSLIAATALANNMAVVTRNVVDLERCRVRVHNPWRD